LFEKFQYAPEAGTTCYTQDGSNKCVRNEKGNNKQYYANNSKEGPTTHAPIVFCFDDNRMEHANYKKCGNCYDNSLEIHLLKFKIYKFKIIILGQGARG
jgi:hypothetical protein